MSNTGAYGAQARRAVEHDEDHVCYVENGRCQYPGCFRQGGPQECDYCPRCGSITSEMGGCVVCGWKSRRSAQGE